MFASPLALLGWKVFWSAQFAQGLDAWPGRVGYRCLVLSLTMGALPLAAVVMSRRGTNPGTPELTVSAIGAGAGLGTAVLVDMWCPVAFVPHLLSDNPAHRDPRLHRLLAGEDAAVDAVISSAEPRSRRSADDLPRPRAQLGRSHEAGISEEPPGRQQTPRVWGNKSI